MNADLLCVVVLCMATVGCASTAASDEMNHPLTASGDPIRGREVFISRDAGHCVLCHTAPGIAVAGNVGPPLAGVGGRLTPAQIRLRIADITRVNPDAAMPAFHRLENLRRAAGPPPGRSPPRVPTG